MRIRKPCRNEGKMAKKNYAAMADGVIRAVGGEGNIANVTHCMTRLRLTLKDESVVSEEDSWNLESDYTKRGISVCSGAGCAQPV